jgi:hypothetical protein
VRVFAELGAGHISEAYIKDSGSFTEGYIEGRHITVNPVPTTVCSLIHELLHRLHPGWGEKQIDNTTTALMRRMTDPQIQQVYLEYNSRKRTRKSAKIVEEP